MDSGFFQKRGMTGREGAISRGKKALLCYTGFSAFIVVTAVAVTISVEGVENRNIHMCLYYTSFVCGPEAAKSPLESGLQSRRILSDSDSNSDSSPKYRLRLQLRFRFGSGLTRGIPS